MKARYPSTAWTQAMDRLYPTLADLHRAALAEARQLDPPRPELVAYLEANRPA